MPILLEDKNRDFQRFRHTAREKLQLSKAGFQHVLSSNVSAIATQDDDLIIRFHGGATYKYFGKADLYRPMLRSNSKGRFVWQKLIRPNVSYSKVGSVRLQGDEELTGKDLMEISRERKETKKPLIESLLVASQIKELGIITSSNIVNSILGTNPL